MLNTAKQPRRYLRKAAVAQRYGTTPRNIEYKVKSGVLPPPTQYFGKYPLWDERVLDQHDDCAAAKARSSAA